MNEATTAVHGAAPRVLLELRTCADGFLIERCVAVETLTGTVVVQGGDEHAISFGPRDAPNRIVLTDRMLTVQTSKQNSVPVHWWIAPDRQRLVMSVDRIDVMAAATGDEVTSAAIAAATSGLQTIPPHSSAEFVIGNDAAIDVVIESKPGWVRHRAHDDAAVAAGARQLAALRAEIANTPRDLPVTALVSGGVDSGSVAALAHEAGILDRLVTIGTEWSDEHQEASELGEYLGMPVELIRLSQEEIVEAIPETIRLVGSADPETVAVGVLLVALFRSRRVPHGTLLTGYGADLINSGLRVDAGTVDHINDAVDAQLANAAVSGEFSALMAEKYEYRLLHPFWCTNVITEALNTDPGLMRFQNREKGHIRAAAASSSLLPDSIAWRQKQALHRGTGVESHLSSAIAARAGLSAIDCSVLYRYIEWEMVAATATHPKTTVDIAACLDAALQRYRTSVLSSIN